MSDASKARVGRPRTRVAPVTIKLSMDKAEKKALQKIAFDLNLSASQLVGRWVAEHREASR